MRIVYSDRALGQLEAIGEHIALDSPGAALRMQARLVDAAASLSALPDRGRPGRRRGARELAIVRPYVIVYRVLADRISVDSIVHGARRR